MINVFSVAALLAVLSLVGYSIAQQQSGSTATAARPSPQSTAVKNKGTENVNPAKLETITLGAGCFWCVEAVFQEVDGVVSVTSGYSNGQVTNPTYEQVCSGNTGCAEVAQIVFDPAKVSLGKILEVFWKTHDPTSLNRQGADSGTQYRSGIYYHTQAQKEYAEMYKAKLNEVNAFGKPVVTEILPVQNFSVAENYHQDYYRNNPNAGYCRNVIIPKLDKFRAVFADVLKDNPNDK
jgi:peptide-methionine (S)-S-oxide reductase